MVLYFSGTGNSAYAARRMARALGDNLCCLTDRIRSRDTSPIETGERLVIVTPTYGWRIPRLVRQHLLASELRGARRAWFVMTCGSEIGNANKYNQALCKTKHLAYMGTAQVVMPENYIAMFNAPGPEEARRIVAAAEPTIEGAIAAIRSDAAFPPTRCHLLDRFLSGPVNPVFYALFVNSRAFTAGDACTGCGQCARLCPTGSITLREGKPVWGPGCTHCMACICRCPAAAIEYGKKSRGKPRYHLDAL